MSIKEYIKGNRGSESVEYILIIGLGVMTLIFAMGVFTYSGDPDPEITVIDKANPQITEKEKQPIYITDSNINIDKAEFNLTEGDK